VVVAVAFLDGGRPIRAGVAIAIGAATKLFPLVALPPLAIATWRRGMRRSAMVLTASTAIALAVIDVPAIIAPYSLLRYGVAPYGVATWNVDSIWFPLAIALDPLFPPAVADTLLYWVSLVGLVASYAVLVLRPASRGEGAERLVWLAVALLVFWTRLRSPQYAIWLLPIFVLFVPDARLLGFMFIGDLAAFVAVFLLRGVARDPGAVDSLALYGTIVFGVVVRQVAVALLITRLRAARATAGRAAGATQGPA
jgi:uncharacterized membrane protein